MNVRIDQRLRDAVRYAMLVSPIVHPVPDGIGGVGKTKLGISLAVELRIYERIEEAVVRSPLVDAGSQKMSEQLIVGEMEQIRVAVVVPMAPIEACIEMLDPIVKANATRHVSHVMQGRNELETHMLTAPVAMRVERKGRQG